MPITAAESTLTNADRTGMAKSLLPVFSPKQYLTKLAKEENTEE